jgi:hypothetical protein
MSKLGQVMRKAESSPNTPYCPDAGILSSWISIPSKAENRPANGQQLFYRRANTMSVHGYVFYAR